MTERTLVPRVGFNATLLSISNDYRAAGIHRYIVGLLAALADQGECALTVFTAEPRAGEVLPAAAAVRSTPPVTRHRWARILWEQCVLPFAARRSRADVVHGAAYAVPALCTVPTVATVHDLSFFRLPATFPARQGAYLRAATRTAVRRAAALIAVSEFTRGELVALLGADPARIYVAPNGLDPACRPLSPDAIAEYRRRAGLPERFILTVGTLQPRKNLGTLLTAYAELARRRREDPPVLVVAGAPGWGDDDPRARVAELGIGAWVRFTGFVPAADLPALYSAATVFALPSRYEGFGLPALEAMACGTPIVVSAAGSLPEVSADAGLAVAPDDVSAWADALAAVLADPTRAATMRERGLARSQAFTWARAARATAAVYRAVAGAQARPARSGSGHGAL
jgi:glycosyltransferase involved in cell wall biosynthesis